MKIDKSQIFSDAIYSSYIYATNGFRFILGRRSVLVYTSIYILLQYKISS